MEIPELVRQQLGDEELESAVNLGDEDVICFTPTRTLIYRGEGLLSDVSLDVYDHDVVRLDVSEGRRKTSFTLTYVDREEQFSVSRGRTEPVLERLLAGVLETADVIDSGESVEGVFRFSELTLIITDARIVKHVGTYVWDADYEEYPYADVTGLEFEEGSVATYIVISVEGRPQRIKAPRSEAALVRRTLTTALFAHYDVESLAQLNDTIGETSSEGEKSPSFSSDIELDDSLAPLVTPDDEDEDPSILATEEGEQGLSAVSTDVEQGSEATARTGSETEGEAVSTDADTSQQSSVADTASSSNADADAETTQQGASSGEAAIDAEDIEAMKTRLTTLTKVAKRQNKLLKQQQETIDQLIEELKRQR